LADGAFAFVCTARLALQVAARVAAAAQVVLGLFLFFAAAVAAAAKVVIAAGVTAALRTSPSGRF